MVDENSVEPPEASDEVAVPESAAPAGSAIDSPEPVDLEPPVPPEPEPVLTEPAAVEEFEPAPPPPPPAPASGGYSPPPPPPPQGQYQAPPGPSSYAPKSRTVAGVLGLLLGGLGVHKFYLGYTNEGLIMLAGNLLWIAGLGWIPNAVGFIEGIIYLTKSDEEFQRTYVAARRPWF